MEVKQGTVKTNIAVPFQPMTEEGGAYRVQEMGGASAMYDKVVIK